MLTFLFATKIEMKPCIDKAKRRERVNKFSIKFKILFEQACLESRRCGKERRKVNSRIETVCHSTIHFASVNWLSLINHCSQTTTTERNPLKPNSEKGKQLIRFSKQNAGKEHEPKLNQASTVWCFDLHTNRQSSYQQLPFKLDHLARSSNLRVEKEKEKN